ncbi:hypothetical protein [Vallitalea sp.]|uniref:hypothetical protein n=1 Tax=Vallitalea sp. TaxID=1882829 RepID=UPI0025CD6768|nr:hypothetical protein [Vallitalea sp.]MCT4686839.1 hypothetical protein [Vallitalea sp.]
MKNKLIIKGNLNIYLFAVLLITVFIFINWYVNSLDFKLKSSGMNGEIVYSRIIDDEILLFYENPSSTGDILEVISIMIKNNKYKIKKEFNTSYSPNFSFNIKFNYGNNNNSVLYYGYIYNTEITKIEMIKSNSEAIDTEIIQTNGKYRMWLYEGFTGDHKIIGYDNDGNKYQ